MKFVNLTPHEIKVYDESGNLKITIPPSGRVARVRTEQKIVGEVCGVQVVQTTYGDVEGIPEPEPGVIYVVSSLVAQAVAGREDVVAPDTSPQGAVRDEKGNIIGVKRFQRW